MRYGIFSDIHGNLQALEAVTKALSREAIDQYCCLGDIVGYGANPHECIETVKGLETVSIAGNHDWAVIGKTDTADFNPLARAAIDWTKVHASPEDLNFLNRLELIFKNEEFILVHGALPVPEIFYYLEPDDIASAARMFFVMENRLAFIGHTHLPGIFMERGSDIRCLRDWQIRMKPGIRYIVNVGSVGQPRDGNPLAVYGIYDTNQQTVSLKRISYDIPEAQRRIIAAGLPYFLASRLATGR